LRSLLHMWLLPWLFPPFRPFLLLLPLPQRSTSFPYTTLFRSPAPLEVPPDSTSMSLSASALRIAASSIAALSAIAPRNDASPPRSEEHTSELQSRENLVCRLLLEKKKMSHNEFKICLLYSIIE